MIERDKLTVELLGKAFQVKCPDNNRAALQEAAAYLNSKMQNVRDHGRVVGIERIAMMAALNVSYELLELKHKKDQSLAPSTLQQLNKLREKIEAVLLSEGQQQLELDTVETT